MTSYGRAPAYVQTPVGPFLNSLSVDKPLARYDLAGSIAHAEMLGRVGRVQPFDARREQRRVGHTALDAVHEGVPCAGIAEQQLRGQERTEPATRSLG